MMTRSRSGSSNEEVDEANESFSIADNTVVENEVAPPASAEQLTTGVTSQLAAIVASIASLNECFKDLRNETQELRDRFGSESSSLENVALRPPTGPATASGLMPQPITGVTFATQTVSWPAPRGSVVTAVGNGPPITEHSPVVPPLYSLATTSAVVPPTSAPLPRH